MEEREGLRGTGGAEVSGRGRRIGDHEEALACSSQPPPTHARARISRQTDRQTEKVSGTWPSARSASLADDRPPASDPLAPRRGMAGGDDHLRRVVSR